MPEENLDGKKPEAVAEVKPPASAESSSQTAPSDAEILEKDFGHYERIDSETVEKQAAPEATVQETGTKVPATGQQTTIEETADEKAIREAKEAQLPEEDRKARVDKQFTRLKTGMEVLQRQLAEAKAKANPPTPQPELQTQVQTPTVQTERPPATKPEDDPKAWAAAYHKAKEAGDEPAMDKLLDGYNRAVARQEYRAERQRELDASRSEQERQQAAIAAERVLKSIASLTASNPAFDFTEDLIDPQAGSPSFVPKTSMGQAIMQMAKEDGVWPLPTLRDVEAYCYKVAYAVNSGSVKLAAAQIRNSQSQAEAIKARMGLESSTRTGPGPREVVDRQRNALRARADKGDADARAQLMDEELEAHFGR